ncbi:hypothetical protein ACIA8E_07550 [Streptomyces sp. NPDC051664]|uniref:hypothetical protein n=1 Tax=Streptomyces sp. NPDC051664 TaxID=3365668 RepID=UPI00379293E0
MHQVEPAGEFGRQVAHLEEQVRDATDQGHQAGQAEQGPQQDADGAQRGRGAVGHGAAQLQLRRLRGVPG